MSEYFDEYGDGGYSSRKQKGNKNKDTHNWKTETIVLAIISCVFIVLFVCLFISYNKETEENLLLKVSVDSSRRQSETLTAQLEEKEQEIEVAKAKLLTIATNTTELEAFLAPMIEEASDIDTFLAFSTDDKETIVKRIKDDIAKGFVQGYSGVNATTIEQAAYDYATYLYNNMQRNKSNK